MLKSRFLAAVGILVVVGAVAELAAQNTPLFAGTWRPHDLSTVLSISDESQDITIRQDAETIAITEPGNRRRPVSIGWTAAFVIFSTFTVDKIKIKDEGKRSRERLA